MNSTTYLASSALVLGATAAVIGGHDALTQGFHSLYSARDMPAASRIAAPTAALVIHLMTGVFVLPLLRRVLRERVMRQAGQTAIVTAIVAVVLRTIAEAATGMVITGLPVYSAALVVTTLAVLPARQRLERGRRQRVAPAFVDALAAVRSVRRRDAA